MAIDDRSQNKVLEMLRNIPGVEQVGTYKFPRSAVERLAEEFPMCVTEANITMGNLLEIMDRVGTHSLLISKQELAELSVEIVECVSRHDYSGTSADERSRNKVLEMLRNIPGVEKVETYKFPRSAVDRIAEKFSMCETEANVTMGNLLEKMDRVGAHALLISKQELVELSIGIVECVDRHDYGTPTKLGAWDYIRGAIGGGGRAAVSAEVPGRDLPGSSIFRRIQSFLGGESDRFRNLTPAQEIKRVGTKTKLGPALANWSGTEEEHDDLVLQVLAAQDDTAVQMLADRFGDVKLLRRISENPLENTPLFLAAYYGSERAIELALSDIDLTQPERFSSREMVRAFRDRLELVAAALAAASYSGHANAVSLIFRMIPDSAVGHMIDHAERSTEFTDAATFVRNVKVLPAIPKRGNAVETIRAWYIILPPSLFYHDPQFIFSILEGVRDGRSELNGGELVDLARELTLGSIPMDYIREAIVNRAPRPDDPPMYPDDDGPPGAGDGRPLIDSIPLENIRDYLEFIDPGLNPTITFEVDGTGIPPEHRTPRTAIIRHFRYDGDEYFQFLTENGWNIVPVWI